MTELQPPSASPRPHHVGRGIFLGTVLAGASSLYWGNRVWTHVSSALAPIEAGIPLIPQGGWRIYTIGNGMPSFDPKTWKLEIGGHVGTPMTLDYEHLLALPKVNQVSTFHCVTGWSVMNVRWGGVRIADVLDLVKPAASAHALQFVSAEVPYVDYLTLEQAKLHNVMLAYEMDGVPLPREHGAPVRLIIPEMYGYKNVKWLNGINVVPAEEIGYWEQYGYDQDAWVGHSNGYGS
jgi:DMSO/TMAO reductase YedYZ molybdopterin-dependent catalytic subunit